MAENTLEKILTPQEHILIGSGTLLEEAKGSGINWYKPEAVSDGTVKDVSLARQRTGWYDSGGLGFILGVKGVAIRLSPLDPKTGETVTDPVVGVKDPKTDEFVERPDLTEVLYAKFKEAGMNPHLRQKPTVIEQESGVEAKG